MDKVFQIVSGILLMVLTALAALAADRANLANASLSKLAEVTSHLASEVKILSQRVDSLPPDSLLLRVSRLEEEQNRMEIKIEKLEHR